MARYVINVYVDELEVTVAVGRNGKFVDEVVLNPQDDWREVIKYFVGLAQRVLRDAGADVELSVYEDGDDAVVVPEGPCKCSGRVN